MFYFIIVLFLFVFSFFLNCFNLLSSFFKRHAITASIPKNADDALTVCKPTVSGAISLPSRGTFHLSLTVLVHYRSPVST